MTTVKPSLRNFLKERQRFLADMLDKAYKNPDLSTDAKQAIAHIIGVEAGALLSVEVELDRLELAK